MRWLLGTTFVGMAGLSLACAGIDTNPTDFYAEVTAPPTVKSGETFPVTFVVYNTAAEPQRLHSLDIDDEYMAGFTVASGNPPYDDTLHIPIDNTESFMYGSIYIPAGGSTTVTLNMTATTPGSYFGEVDVCVNGDARYLSYPMSTAVQ